jgi:hypothetical protein
MSFDNQDLLAKLADILITHVEPIFEEGIKISLIVRVPGNDEADVLVSNDDLDELAAFIERGRTREIVRPL